MTIDSVSLLCTDAYSLKEAKCVPPQNFDAKGESTLTTRLHDSLSAPQFTDMMACSIATTKQDTLGFVLVNST